MRHGKPRSQRAPRVGAVRHGKRQVHLSLHGKVREGHLEVPARRAPQTRDSRKRASALLSLVQNLLGAAKPRDDALEHRGEVPAARLAGGFVPRPRRAGDRRGERASTPRGHAAVLRQRDPPSARANVDVYAKESTDAKRQLAPAGAGEALQTPRRHAVEHRELLADGARGLPGRAHALGGGARAEAPRRLARRSPSPRRPNSFSPRRVSRRRGQPPRQSRRPCAGASRWRR